MIEFISEMFSYTFMARAFLVGTMVSLCAALLGIVLVLRHFAMIGDGLSHVSFAALAVANSLGLPQLQVAIPVVILAAFGILRVSTSSKIHGDSAVALLSTGALALGVMVVSLTTGMNTDVCNFMFGSILSMSKADVRLSIGLSIVVLILFVFFYNRIFAVTFDENFAAATGVKASRYNMLIALCTALVIVLGMRMMGSLLISSLIVFPAMTAMRVCKRFMTVTINAVCISVTCFLVGMTMSYAWATPTGAGIVACNIVMFAIYSVVGLCLSRRGRA